MISYNWAYIEYSRGRNCHSFFFISTSKLTVIMRTLDPPRFYCGRRRFRVFELLLSCELNWSPVSPSAYLFCHICGRANSTWTYYSKVKNFLFEKPLNVPYFFIREDYGIRSLHHSKKATTIVFSLWQYFVATPSMHGIAAITGNMHRSLRNFVLLLEHITSIITIAHDTSYSIPRTPQC